MWLLIIKYQINIKIRLSLYIIKKFKKTKLNTHNRSQTKTNNNINERNYTGKKTNKHTIKR